MTKLLEDPNFITSSDYLKSGEIEIDADNMKFMRKVLKSHRKKGKTRFLTDTEKKLIKEKKEFQLEQMIKA